MADLAVALRGFLPVSVGLGLARLGESDGDWAGEHLPRAIPSRQAEFRAGRVAARRAMAAAGLDPSAVPMGRDRAPIWPVGMRGSIAHCEGACVSLIARAGEVASLGLDIEPSRDLPRPLWDTVLLQSEMQEVERQEQPGLHALAHFVAKEAVYKAQYPLTGALFDFHTLEIVFNGDHFSARFTKNVQPFAPNTQVQGRLVLSSGFICALVVLA